jgi:ferrous iron transport protein A
MLAVCDQFSSASLSSLKSASLLFLNLSSLKKGAHAVVVGLAETEHSELLAIKQRLAELGFIPGETLHVIARSFRDRVAVRIGNTIFALRGHEASMIYVHVTQ